jgi:hypothetical protein
VGPPSGIKDIIMMMIMMMIVMMIITTMITSHRSIFTAFPAPQSPAETRKAEEHARLEEELARRVKAEEEERERVEAAKRAALKAERESKKEAEDAPGPAPVPSKVRSFLNPPFPILSQLQLAVALLRLRLRIGQHMPSFLCRCCRIERTQISRVNTGDDAFLMKVLAWVFRPIHAQTWSMISTMCSAFKGTATAFFFAL